MSRRSVRSEAPRLQITADADPGTMEVLQLEIVRLARAHGFEVDVRITESTAKPRATST